LTKSGKINFPLVPERKPIYMQTKQTQKVMFKQTPLYLKHIEANANIVNFHGWLLPVHYSGGILTETKQTRISAGIFDISHMGEIEVKGSDAIPFLQKLVTNDISSTEKGDIQYNMACTPEGGIIDDFMIYNKGENSFLCVVNASNIENIYNWFIGHKENLSVEIFNQSDNTSLIAIQGPASEKILQSAGFNVNGLFYMHFVETTLQEIPVIVSRSGYTGEDGFEIYSENSDACRLWEILLSAGKKYHLQLCGLGARDILRLEMGYPLYGNDIDINTTPVEASLEWAVKVERKDFIGK